MSHETKIVAYKQLSDGQVAFCVRCCGDASTDSWQTVSAEVASKPSARKKSLASHHSSVAAQHEAMLQSTEGALDEIGESIKHP